MCLFLNKGFEETVSLSSNERVSLVEELLTSLNVLNPYRSLDGQRIHSQTDERRKTMKLKVGMKAPDFTLPSQLDKKIRLKSLLGKGPVALAFFPLAWTPV
jgi:hypothetical protein